MDAIKINRLREVLDAKGLKQKWLASQLNISEVIVSLWSSNKAQPSLSKLRQIANILSVDVRDLLESNFDIKEGEH